MAMGTRTGTTWTWRTTMSEKSKVWHFTKSDGNGGAVLRDGRPVVVGKTLVHNEATEGGIEICVRGLHSSVRVVDALAYAPGCMVSLCDAGGRIIEGDDKVVIDCESLTSYGDGDRWTCRSCRQRRSSQSLTR